MGTPQDPGAGPALAAAWESLENEQLEDARRAALAVLEGSPGNVAALTLLGQVELAADHEEEALRWFRTAVQLEPENVVALKDLALAQSETGDLAGGEATLRRALALAPRYLPGHYFLSMMKRYTADDPDLAALRRLAEDIDSLGDRERMRLGFALGKALDDTGDHEGSFAALRMANAAKRAGMDYEVDGDLRFMKRVRRTFDAARIASPGAPGSDTELPVLIVGMPRSGSTLVEQILAAHPQVSPGGERSSLAHVSAAVQLLGDHSTSFPDGLAELDPRYLAQLGDGYAARLRRYATDTPRVTDKNLFNFAYLGMARLITPHAHVVHVMREPLDSCVSMFGLDFQHVRFAFDLDELGRFYRGYEQLMDHWRAVLPRGWMLEIRYEDLVADIETGARRLIDHCGLEWDDACLRFHEAQRTVRTASFAQVRQPLHGRSVGRWRRYEPWLRELQAALAGETAPEPTLD